MDAASPKFSPSLSRDGSSLRNRLDLKASSTAPAKATSSPNLRVQDRVEIGEERLPFRKPRATAKSPLTGFFERARARLQEFLDASKEAKAAKKAKEQEEAAEDQIQDPSSKAKETKPRAEEAEENESSLQDIFKKREAEDAYKAINRRGASKRPHAADPPAAGS